MESFSLGIRSQPWQHGEIFKKKATSEESSPVAHPPPLAFDLQRWSCPQAFPLLLWPSLVTLPFL